MEYLPQYFITSLFPDSYPMGARGFFPGAWSWPLASIWYRSYECVELYLLSPACLNGVVLSEAHDTSSWRGA